ncbi:DinB family protein [Muricauda sp. CAU 1633]|uniref:DinB family protein n=1 Tax=Allomuricauda sp. CAU 1633 TaxID=2816036 RepID=UPI001A8E047E|nr:DinB family protein [Muricauda sp. CAU 1633]MBO0323826.1 DinB family protein [Muricauda sp. CAU 1633]
MKTTRSEFMASRLREVLLNGRWVAQTNIKEQIESVTKQQAIQKIGSLNSIALLTYHLNYYLGGILNVFQGGALEIRDKYSFDMPPIQSETDWKNLIHEFVVNAEKFTLHVERMEDTTFDEPFVDEKYGTYQRNIEGVIEHSYYHLGQIVLIKKMIQAE